MIRGGYCNINVANTMQYIVQSPLKLVLHSPKSIRIITIQNYSGDKSIVHTSRRNFGSGRRNELLPAAEGRNFGEKVNPVVEWRWAELERRDRGSLTGWASWTGWRGDIFLSSSLFFFPFLRN